ncbi:MAG: Mini-ribonuclease 3 [Erysipelotrichaceae bacterium]|nr:Mini-ribonuclease 3 [Erysipelotrichaceae bacterium]MCI9313325.1 Mini-ribonuclease 3 [Erysipelotrichaceae bacterium]
MKIEETLSTAELAAYNATTLAYIGDAVMSLWVRTHLIMQGCGKTGVLQKQSEAWVSARAQSTYLRALMDQGFFDEAETAIILRGRNSKTESRAKNASMMEYRMATGLEALIGYLYLSNQTVRMQELWNEILKLGEAK